MTTFFAAEVKPDWEGLVNCIMRRGTPARVHNIELFLDGEVQEAICGRFNVLDGLDPGAPEFQYRKAIAIQRFLGYDHVRCGVEGFEMPLKHIQTEDTSEALQRVSGRSYMEEHQGPITTWEEFENYPWPDPATVSTRTLEWYEQNLPDDMCIIGSGGFGHFAEMLAWLMGYETLCFALYDQRDLVEAIRDRLVSFYSQMLEKILQFDRVKLVWGSDDMGFKTQTLISPDDTREFILPGHKLMAEMAHAAGRPYLLHSCGNLNEIYPDLIEDVKIDAKHSYEDVIEDPIEVKAQYGEQFAVLGGIDVDFLCRADEEQVRRRVRHTLEQCMAGGGYVLGTGNSVANYIPLDNYLAMLDEGRRWPYNPS